MDQPGDWRRVYWEVVPRLLMHIRLTEEEHRNAPKEASRLKPVAACVHCGSPIYGPETIAADELAGAQRTCACTFIGSYMVSNFPAYNPAPTVQPLTVGGSYLPNHAYLKDHD
jgi:hypothetical protein